jgi:hypothetical protein
MDMSLLFVQRRFYVAKKKILGIDIFPTRVQRNLKRVRSGAFGAQLD